MTVIMTSPSIVPNRPVHYHLHMQLFTNIISWTFYAVSTVPWLCYFFASGQSWVAGRQIREGRYREHDAHWCHHWRILRRLGQTTHETWYGCAHWLTLHLLYLSFYAFLSLRYSPTRSLFVFISNLLSASQSLFLASFIFTHPLTLSSTLAYCTLT